MLIKMQKTRFSYDYLIIDSVTDIVYSDKPLTFIGETEIVGHMQKFINSDDSTALKRTAWYQLDADPNWDLHPDEKKFPYGYAINKIAFTNARDEREEILFDGEAFICNDDGKTIHRIKRGGGLPPAPPAALAG